MSSSSSKCQESCGISVALSLLCFSSYTCIWSILFARKCFVWWDWWTKDLPSYTISGLPFSNFVMTVYRDDLTKLRWAKISIGLDWAKLWETPPAFCKEVFLWIHGFFKYFKFNLKGQSQQIMDFILGYQFILFDCLCIIFVIFFYFLQ